jgi:hypothetical protein
MATPRETLEHRLAELLANTNTARRNSNLNQSLGIASAVAGVGAIAAAGPLGPVFLVGGAAIYIYGTVERSIRCGRVLPLPYGSIDIDGVGEFLSDEAGDNGHRETMAAYMSLPQRVEYALLTTVGASMAEAIEAHQQQQQSLSAQWLPHYEALIERLAETYIDVPSNLDLSPAFRQHQAEIVGAIAQHYALPSASPKATPKSPPKAATDKATAPADAVALPPQGAQWDSDDDDVIDPLEQYGWLRQLLQAPALLLYGPQGSGKSTLAELIIYLRHRMGFAQEVLDPHAAHGQWAGMQVYGQGMNYGELTMQLQSLQRKIGRRYQRRSQEPNYNPQPLGVILEELTNWGDRTSGCGEFVKASLSDNRKIAVCSLYVGHGRELGNLGDAKGIAAMRDQGMMELQLEADTGPDGKPCPKGSGLLRMPNGSMKDRATVAMPDLSDFRFNLSAPLPASLAWLEQLLDECAGELRSPPAATSPEPAPTEAEPTDNAAAILAYAQLQDGPWTASECRAGKNCLRDLEKAEIEKTCFHLVADGRLRFVPGGQAAKFEYLD